MFSADVEKRSNVVCSFHSLAFSSSSCGFLLVLLKQPFHLSRQTIREFNHYVVIMVNCLCNWRMFQPGIGVQLEEELLLQSNVPQYWSRFGLVHHPAFIGYAVDFHQRVSLVHFAKTKYESYIICSEPIADHIFKLQQCISYFG